MSRYLRRYFPAAILLTIASSAWLSGRIGNTFLGEWIEPAPRLALSPMGKPLHAAVDAVTVNVGKLGGLFGLQPPLPLPPGPNPPTHPPGPPYPPGPRDSFIDPVECRDKGEPVKSHLPLQLLASMIANEKQWSSALIFDVEKKESRRYVVGDVIRGFAICDVVRGFDHDRVVIANTAEHSLEFIDNASATGSVGLTDIANAGPPNPKPPTDSGKGITRVDEHSYAITRERLHASLANPAELASKARAIPSFKNGQPDGIKILSIEPGSVYDQLGIKNGDVIQSINGLAMDTPEQALQAYSQLSTATSFQVDLKRNGQDVKSSYSVGGP